jgi:hypothetical protein
MEKRLVLFKEQAAAIDQRNGRLESENAELKRALDAVTRERDQLRADVAQITKSDELDETEKNLLKALVTTDAANAQTLASHVGTDPVRAEYYLQKLEQGEYIYGQHFMGSASLYSRPAGTRISDQESAYLISLTLRTAVRALSVRWRSQVYQRCARRHNS